VWAIKTYNVRFLDWNDVEIDVQTIEHGSDANSAEAINKLPSMPEKMMFDKWDVDITNITGTITAKAILKPDGTTSLRNKGSVSKHGILLEKALVSDVAKMTIILPSNERVVESKVVIYDMTGNVVFNTTVRGDRILWNLTNSAGRFVANGSYLVVVEAKGTSGKVHQYNTKFGVNR